MDESLCARRQKCLTDDQSSFINLNMAKSTFTNIPTLFSSTVIAPSVLLKIFVHGWESCKGHIWRHHWIVVNTCIRPTFWKMQSRSGQMMNFGVKNRKRWVLLDPECDVTWAFNFVFQKSYTLSIAGYQVHTGMTFDDVTMASRKEQACLTILKKLFPLVFTYDALIKSITKDVSSSGCCAINYRMLF